jgi:hypothetical protein
MIVRFVPSVREMREKHHMFFEIYFKYILSQSYPKLKIFAAQYKVYYVIQELLHNQSRLLKTDLIENQIFSPEGLQW